MPFSACHFNKATCGEKRHNWQSLARPMAMLVASTRTIINFSLDIRNYCHPMIPTESHRVWNDLAGIRVPGFRVWVPTRTKKRTDPQVTHVELVLNSRNAHLLLCYHVPAAPRQAAPDGPAVPTMLQGAIQHHTSKQQCENIRI